MRRLLLQKMAQRRHQQMQLPKPRKTLHNKRKKEDTNMNQENRRLKEIQREKILFQNMLDKSESISDCLTYQGKLEILEKEEKEILARNDVII